MPLLQDTPVQALLQRKLALKIAAIHHGRERTLLDGWILPRHKRPSTKTLASAGLINT